MKRQTTARLAFEGGIDAYNPATLRAFSPATLQHEYSRLRSIARKRLERFEGTEWTNTQVYLENKGKFKPVKEIKDPAELRHLLSDVARYVTNQTGSVSGLKVQRARAIETYHRHGYTFVNKSNYRKFVEFMEYARVRNIAHMYDSARVAEVFEEHQEENAEELQQVFNDWQTDQDEQRRIQHRESKSSRLYRKEYKKRGK